jgi:hypothetical protein
LNDQLEAISAQANLPMAVAGAKGFQAAAAIASQLQTAQQLREESEEKYVIKFKLILN